MNKKIAIPILLFLAIAAIAVIATVFGLRPTATKGRPGALDSFAQCLSSKGATMYGAYWCPHCQEEKSYFGSSFQYVNYVECTKDVDKCIAAKIQGYPTWIYPDGKTYEGTQSLKDLSAQSGCALPQGY